MVTGIKKSLFGLLLLCIFATSCEKEEEKIDISASKTMSEIRKEVTEIENTGNIDFSETFFLFPEVDEINDVNFYVKSEGTDAISTFDSVKEEFYEAVKDFTGDMPDDQYINLVLGDDNRTLINIDDVDNEILKKSDLYEYLLSYNDGMKSLLLYANSFMCEMGGEEVSKLVTPTESWLGFRPEDELKVDSYDLLCDDFKDVSYSINGESVSLKDSIDYVENEMKKRHPFFSSVALDYKVYEVDVYKIDDNNYYYKMYVMACYNGVPLQCEQWSDVYSKDSDDAEFNYIDKHTVDIMKKGSIDYIWSCAHTYDEDKIESGKRYDRFVSLKSAVKLVSKEITAERIFKCSKVEMVYRPVEIYNELEYSFYDEVNETQVSGSRNAMKGLACHPIYLFKFTDTGLPDYPILYYGVDSTTGDVLSIRGETNE